MTTDDDEEVSELDLGRDALAPAEQLYEVACTIRLWQEGQSPKISDNAMLQRYPALGSTKTYAKFRARDSSQLDVFDWLPRYRGVLEQIEAERSSQTEEIYPELSFATEIYTVVLRLVQARGLNRLVLIEGSSGHGKTESLRMVARRLPGNIISCEADESWARPAVAVGAMAVAAGAVRTHEDLPQKLADRLALLLAKLRSGRRILIIDEGHHMGGKTLNLIKTLLNRTGTAIIIGTMDTVWKKLVASAAQEAKQLVLNRLFARVRLIGPTEDDALLFFSRRLQLDVGNQKKAIQQITATARTHGGMAYLRNVAERCHELLGNDKVDSATLLQAAAHVKAQIE